MRIGRIFAALALTALAVLVVVPAPASAQGGSDSKSSTNEIYQANAMNLMGPAAGRSVGITFTITSFATDADKQTLADALAEGGSEGLMKALKKMDCGYVAATGRISWTLNAAWKEPTEDGGYRIRGMFQRQTGFRENYANTRSLDYDFSLFELVLDAKGKGKGQIIPAAKITFTKSNTIAIENFGAQPALLMGLTRRK